MIDVSIMIVHYNTPKLLRQTLKGIRSSALKVSYEVIVVDNNPRMRVHDMIAKEFPETRVLMSDCNLGFGGGMNRAMEAATGRYLLVFNPDICLFPGAIEELVRFMDEHRDVGMVGPQLKNPDGSIQHSCFRFMKPEIIAYRRVPILRNLSVAKKAVDEYLMADWDHKETRDVDYLLGAAMLVRREAYQQVGPFDPQFFVYFEDQDWCRRFWKTGWRVVYHPGASIIHYHRRETAEGGFIAQLRNPLTRIQMKSALYYYGKYKGEGNPRLARA
jgi:GT2 family glycosyltransferase